MHQKVIFLACFFICADCFAQEYSFVYYTPRDGLVNSRVRSIKQDSKGRMYFITYAGLSIYDGTRFINYSKQEGLANELINDVVEAAPDSLLIACNTPLLNTLVHGSIGVYKTSDNFYPIINRFLKSAGGYLYAAADDGLFLLKNRKFIPIPLHNKEGDEIGKHLDKIIEWRNYLLLIPWNPKMNEKLIVYDQLAGKVTDIYTQDPVAGNAIDRKGRIWISNGNGIHLLDTTLLKNGKIGFQQLPAKYREAADQKNVSIFFDSGGNSWLYGGNHILKVSDQDPPETISSPQGLNAGNLMDIYEDHEGIFWMATDGNGIIKLTNTHVQLLRNFLSGKPASISAITSQADTVWFFDERSYSVFRLYKNSLTSFHFPFKKMTVNNMYIDGHSIFMEGDKKIIRIPNKDEIYLYSKSAVFFEDSSQTSEFGNGVVDPHGGIIQYIRKDGASYILSVINGKKEFMNYRVSAMADQMVLDQEARLWVITRDNHLMIFKLNPQEPAQYLQLLKDFSKELPDMSPRSIAIDKEHNVWIGTRYDGIYRLQFHELTLQSAKQFTMRNDLSSNFVYYLSYDSANNTLWAGTQGGLDKIFLKNGQYIIGNVSKSNNFFKWIVKIVISKDNTIWALANDRTLLKISPSAKTNHAVAPPLLLTSLFINNVRYPDETRSFSYLENNFSFSVASPSFIDEKSIKYNYMLEGSGNSKWSTPSGNSVLNFINLAPGKYILHIKAEFPEAMYDPQRIQFSFRITPPWWQTWWFRTGMGLMGIGLLFLIIRTYYRRKLEKQKFYMEKQHAIEKERTRIATDMHDDLGAGLSRIKFLSETIGIKKQKEEPIGEDISKIRDYSDEMIDKMGEIVWALNEKNDSLSDLLAYTRSYAVEYLSQNGIVCTIEAPEVFPVNFVTGEYRRNFFLSVKEALHNIVKHAQATHIAIRIVVSKNLQICIEDNGTGFNRNNIRPYSNGLMNMEKRMTDLNGHMEINSVRGTTIILTAPLPL